MHDLRRHITAPLNRLDSATVEHDFRQAWSLTEYLFASLRNEQAYLLRPDPLRHPLVFYFGHVAAFYVNKLVLAGVWSAGVDTALDSLFAKGIDPSAPSTVEPRVSWPSCAVVHRYRENVFARVVGAIGKLDWSRAQDPHAPTWSILMAIEHERVHFETSSVLFRQAPLDDLQRPPGWRIEPTDVPPPPEQWVDVPAGDARLGRSSDLPLFGWDIDFGSESRHVEAFRVARDLVTNAQFSEFVAAGGYEEERYWSEAGWTWKSFAAAKHPRFWVADGAQAVPGHRMRAVFEELPVPPAWPAEVNAHEAHAYCRFRGGCRLPTELEWIRMLDLVDPGRVDRYGLSHHLNLRSGSPAAVGTADVGFERPIHDVRGNVWQWLDGGLHPLPGYAPHRLYDDWSAPYFDDEHSMMRGGSWATTGAGASPYYRNWFRHQFAQHAGFRLVMTVW